MDRKSVLICGGGLSGLAAGEILAEKGYLVTVIEQEDVLGGLARSFKHEDEWIPITYHHVMKPDIVTQEYLKRLGMWKKFLWRKSSQTFWYDGKEYPLSQPYHILGFSPLSFKSRLKLFEFGAYCWLRKDWSKLGNHDCESWLRKKVGNEVVDKIFKKLFDIKFSIPMNSISMAWLGRRLHQSLRSSDSYAYPTSGVYGMVEAMACNIVRNGGEIKTSCKVEKIEEGKVYLKDTDGRTVCLSADIIISSLPIAELLGVCKFSPDIEKEMSEIKYKPMISMVFASKDVLSKFYWSVMIKPDLSFGGIFNHSTINPGLMGKEKYLYYTFTYLNEGDEFLNKSEKDIKDVYLADLRKINKNFRYDWAKVFKIKNSQPVFFKGYKNLPIKPDGSRNIFLTGVYRTYPKPRTMDSALGSGMETANYILGECKSSEKSMFNLSKI